MSRCEHNELITKFCISDSCQWREAAGCDICFQKYHSHTSMLDYISLDKLQKMNSKLIVKIDTKAKCRGLQESIYNYFMIAKSQINSSLDSVSRQISNRLNYPYLVKEQQLSVHKKLNHREFKRINKKELINFCDFVKKVDPETLEASEKQLYLLEIEKTNNFFHQIKKVFQSYKQSLALFEASFNIDRNFYDKVIDVIASIKDAHPKPNSSTKPSKPQTNLFTNILKLPEEKKKQRRVSFDMAISKLSNVNELQTKFSNPVSFEKNEKQIMDKKRKLLEMLNKKEEKQDQKEFETKNDQKQKQTQQNQEQEEVSITINIKQEVSPQNNIKEEVLPQNNIKEEVLPQKNIEISQRNQQNSGKQVEQKINCNQNIEGELQGRNIFAQLIEKGLNIPQMIVHTIIPAGQQKIKLYQDSRNVKEHKIKVQMKKFDTCEEVSSPLLKKKKKKTSIAGIKLLEVNNDEKKDEQVQNAEENADEDVVLMDQQTNSLALLIESLHLPANSAIPLLQAAIKYSSNNLSAADYLSYLYLEIGQGKKCLHLCTNMLERLQGSPQGTKLGIHLNNNKAAALNMLGRYSQSISILEKCLEESKRDITFKNLGDAYFSIGIYEKAVFNYEKAVTLNSQMDEAYYNLAVSLFMQGHFNESLYNIQNAVRLNKNMDAYQQLLKEVSCKV